MINELLVALNKPQGYLIHKGHEVYCTGEEGHNLGILAPIDGSDFIAIGNPTDEGMFIPDSTQPSLDTTLTCALCGAKGATL